MRFFWIASCRKGCRDSSIRTTSWDESILVSSTVGGEKNKEQGCRVALSLLDDILRLCYRRSTTLESRERAFQIKKITGNLLTRIMREVDFTT